MEAVKASTEPARASGFLIMGFRLPHEPAPTTSPKAEPQSPSSSSITLTTTVVFCFIFGVSKAEMLFLFNMFDSIMCGRIGKNSPLSATPRQNESPMTLGSALSEFYACWWVGGLVTYDLQGFSDSGLWRARLVKKSTGLVESKYAPTANLRWRKTDTTQICMSPHWL